MSCSATLYIARKEVPNAPLSKLAYALNSKDLRDCFAPPEPERFRVACNDRRSVIASPEHIHKVYAERSRSIQCKLCEGVAILCFEILKDNIVYLTGH